MDKKMDDMLRHLPPDDVDAHRAENIRRRAQGVFAVYSRGSRLSRWTQVCLDWIAPQIAYSACAYYVFLALMVAAARV